MSRSEQTQDAGMDEILASIRRIISDDDPEAPDADVLNAALDVFTGAPQSAPESYMGDLTRALISEPAPQSSDDDIFDEALPAPGYARRMSEALAEAIRAPQAAPAPAMPELAPEIVDDDADLFEIVSAPVEESEDAEPIKALEIAIETVAEDEDDAAAELDDPIALGPEIELVDELADVDAPVQDPIVVQPIVAAMPNPVLPASVAMAPPPPPPPPPVSLESRVALDDVPAPEAEVLVEAKAPIEPDAPAEPAVQESAVAAETPATIEADASVPIGEVEPAAAETMPENEPELVAAAGADAPSAIDEAPAEPVAPESVASAEPSPETDAAAPAVTAAPPAEATHAPAAAPGVSEDMMAALLKPMLKEWLDANMPRIVAKAMGDGGKSDADAPAS